MDNSHWAGYHDAAHMKALSDELDAVNIDCFFLNQRVAELEEENLRLLGMVLDMKDAAVDSDYLGFPKFIARQAVAAINALGQKVHFSRR